MSDEAGAVDLDNEIVADKADSIGGTGGKRGNARLGTRGGDATRGTGKGMRERWVGDELNHAEVLAAVHLQTDGIALLQAAFARDIADEEWDAGEILSTNGRVVAGGHQASALIAPLEFLGVVADSLPRG